MAVDVCEVDSRIMWSIPGWNGGSDGDLYDEDIFDIHILSDFLKVKFIGVLLEICTPKVSQSLYSCKTFLCLV